jgi:hypothetical protein
MSRKNILDLGMGETDNKREWPALQKDDAELQKELFSLLTSRVPGNPYSSDGSFAKNLEALRPGLRAMAATHWLDISLTLDSMTWHFGNFGEPGLVAATEAGLTELGLDELASCFREAKELMVPLLYQRTEADGDSDEILERRGLDWKAKEINDRAWDLDDLGPKKSLIYDAWVRYARLHPENVFGT